jgi:putative tryptophan/tyrosine transport system substrate-binding protein
VILFSIADFRFWIIRGRSQTFSIGALAVFLWAISFSAEAQQVGKIPRVGYVSVRGAESQAPVLEGFRQGLRELGYIEGKNIIIEYRFAEGKRDLVPSMISELVQLKVDLIVSGGARPTRAAKQATSTIPIVFAQDLDPIGNGFVISLARPGGNITGLSTLQVDVAGKRLELLKEVVPKLSRVAVIGSSTSADNARELKETEAAAAALGLKIRFFDMRTPKEIASTFQAAVEPRPDGLSVLTNSFERRHRKQLVDLASKLKLPSMYFGPTLVEDGGLMSYGVNDADLYRRAAVFVDKILKGAKPSELPVEQPTKLDLVINLRAAKQIGLTIPQSVLGRADKVIK